MKKFTNYIEQYKVENNILPPISEKFISSSLPAESSYPVPDVSPLSPKYALPEFAANAFTFNHKTLLVVLDSCCSVPAVLTVVVPYASIMVPPTLLCLILARHNL